MKTTAGVEILPGGVGFLKVVPGLNHGDKSHPGGSTQVYSDGRDERTVDNKCGPDSPMPL